MIRLFDATKLAVTKLRTRKIRLFITIFIAGLLFSLLAAASQISRGSFDSINAFSKEGLGGRYILAANPNSNGSVQTPATNETVIARAEAINKDIIARKTIEAKRLDIAFDAKNEPLPVEEFDTPQGKQRNLSYDHPAALQAMQEYAAQHPGPGKPELQKAAAPYGGGTIYESRMLVYGPKMPSLKVLKDGKESYDEQLKPQNGPPSGIDGFTQGWSLLSSDLLQPFMLPGATANKGADGSLPVVAPYSAAEQLLGLKALPASAKPAERLERLKLLRAKAGDITFQVCYRNQESNSLLNRAIGQRQEVEKNKAVKDYVKPSLIYALPAKPCTAPTIEKDSRTADEKKQAAKQEEFDRLFGTEPPTEQIVSFRLIGIAPDPFGFGASGLSSLVGMLLTSNLGGSGWYSPAELQASNPLISQLFDGTKGLGGGFATYYLETTSSAQAKKIIEKANCQPDFNLMQSDSLANPFEECEAQGKYFSFFPYGSNSLALEDAKSSFGKFFGYASLGVALVAALIMVGTVGRIIADSRRETAVFRAIGAKKFDIVQIYLVYTFFLAIFIYIFALLAGFAIAQYINSRYSAELTIQALVAYNAQDLSRSFNLYSFYWPDMLKLLGLSLAGGALSAFFPLIRNLRRNPIRDMRDDT